MNQLEQVEQAVPRSSSHPSPPAPPAPQIRAGAKRANSVSLEDKEKFRSRINSLFKGSFNEGDDYFKKSRSNSLYRPMRSADLGSVFKPDSLYFVNHRTLTTAKECTLISTEELCQFLVRHYTAELPETERMFPWLHGVHKNNAVQLRFLSSLTNQIDSDLQIGVPSNVRGLMPVRSASTSAEANRCDDILAETTGQIKGTVSPHDMLVSVFSVRNVELYLLSILPEDILSSFPIDMLVKDCVSTQLLPLFKDMDPQVGVSLRNFHIQVSKMSNISDLVVYCFNDDHERSVRLSKKEDSWNGKCKCASLARLLHIAQLMYASDHPELAQPGQRKLYNTFVLDDVKLNMLEAANLLSIPLLNPDASSKATGDLCSEYDIEVFNNWDSNYLYREKLEISKMSSATEVLDNVWFGNTTDFECLHIQLNSGKKPASVDLKSSNFPLHCDPSNTVVILKKNDLAQRPIREVDAKLITFPRAHWKLFVHCIDGARFPTPMELRTVISSIGYLQQIYLEFPPSGSVEIADLSEEDILCIVNVCKLLCFQCTKDFPGLLYCSDGYTETSLLGLCFIMYSQKIGIDEAIIRLHMQYGRPFFIFKSDYLLLQKLEPIILKFAQHKGDKLTLEDDRGVVKSFLLAPKHVRHKATLDMSFNSVLHTATGQHVVHLREQQKRRAKDLDSDTESTSSLSSAGTDLEVSGLCESVAGSIPSRVLPHLYLGSLSHASSLRLLKELGINYVVSVGEHVPWLDDLEYATGTTESGCEIFKICSDQKVDGSDCGVEEVMRINNINDDGIGTLTTTINDALDFIDKCYESNGKVLVHCQVGVSRSATVCIAEVMKRINVSLPRAYLYVRVRRLNVIIQPNLKLMYELFKWEELFMRSKLKKRQFSVSSQSSNGQSNNSTFSTNHSGRSSFSNSVGSVSSTFISSSARDKPRFSLAGYETAISEEADEFDIRHLDLGPEDVISNTPGFIREVDWYIFCREIFNLNRAYIKPGK
ncbi:hypothetical protein KL925_002068 [Ogataea polymorpha]|nr:hypothetical protein KL936_002227 [Ogataea polymorpha]KAG7927710.1 hypothetical protein KL925_002068 [Ogataea polymorpha]